MVDMKIVWQCGHCGVVYKTKKDADECCDGDAEKSFECGKCGRLYSFDLGAIRCCNYPEIINGNRRVKNDER